MKPSLEQERRALLEQIEASRAVYRRMLSGEPAGSRSAPAPGVRHASAVQHRGRGKAVQWMMDHPLWVAGGVTLFVLVAPRLFGAGRHAAQRRRQEKQRARRQQEESSGTLRALLTAAVLLMRDPARLRAAARMANGAWQWLQRRRQPPKTVTRVGPSERVTTRVH